MHGCGARNIRFKFREPLPEEAPQIDRLQVLSRKSKVGHITERPLGTAVNVRPHKTAFRKGSLDVLHALVVAVFQNEGRTPSLIRIRRLLTTLATQTPPSASNASPSGKMLRPSN